MSRAVFLLIVVIFTSARAFDAGFLEWGATRAANDKDTTHYGVTICALCRATIDYLQSIPKINATSLNAKFNESNGQCGSSILNEIVVFLQSNQQVGLNPWQYVTTVRTIATANTKTDLKEAFNTDSHFDSEQLIGGSQLVLKRYQSALDSVQNDGNYDQARKTFGEMLHTLQDFYSHSNFIELNFTTPSDVLGRRVFRSEEFASAEMRTCVSCTGLGCQTNSNLDEEIVRRRLLTTGYFIPLGTSLIFGKKPKGKCSHGGPFDGSSTDEPIGGINKDKLGAVHGHLHYKAASMSYRGTLQILQQLRSTIGDDAFALFLTLKKITNSLVISINTACSMADYVELAKNISVNIVNQYGQLDFAPYNYVLVTFTGDSAELLVNSRDPRDLASAIQRLSACQKRNITNGELYYHALIEGLKSCEYASVFYTFTDSPARDGYLKNQARALIRSKRAVVYSFMGVQMKARTRAYQADVIDPLDGSNNDLDLAWISGGLTHFITAADQPAVAQFILRRLEWTRLQSIFMYRSRATSEMFHVDTSVTELYLDISSMGEITNVSAVELRQPDGSLYPLSGNFIQTKHLCMWKISQPAAGAWRLTTANLSGPFDYDVQVQGKTSAVCSSTLQKEMNPNTDSSGYTLLTSEPSIGGDLLVLTTCENTQATAVNISLINQSGQVIASYSPYQLDQLSILTRIRVPNQPFRIRAVITASTGQRMQRIEKQLLSPTMFSIELLDQPYIVAEGETVRMNYTIRSGLSQPVSVRLQIFDTMKLMGENGVDSELTFVNQTSGTSTITLPKRYQAKVTTNLVIFAVSTQDNQTRRYVHENDETVSVYLDINGASRGSALLWLIIPLVGLIHRTERLLHFIL